MMFKVIIDILICKGNYNLILFTPFVTKKLQTELKNEMLFNRFNNYGIQFGETHDFLYSDDYKYSFIVHRFKAF